MSQIKIYAQQQTIRQFRATLSQAIHQALVHCFNLPEDKCFQRFIALHHEDFIYPNDRSAHYTIIEISMFEGRSEVHKKQLIRTIFQNIQQQCGISPQDIEITLFETPRSHWGIRGKLGDELQLNYAVDLE
ncbi:tautomerase family protein [Acinetobacter rathckeae]|uniref:tautomerase family protein n=1 Tax=Acinetobacter rathckeae TaxID=2605272 RepID=UPI0018A31246|nr:tautomerase family protein [Acinetobacter rathckeae]MBF7688462.1 tautomerase family protein [Acinetobacter rathckeae]MBF7695546.1 tautomerase family protein [Acinetobacter rathckeae]